MTIAIALQTPSVELKVQADKDAGNETAFIYMGFKRYPLSEGETKFKELSEYIQNSEEEKVTKFIFDNVLYLREVPLVDIDDVTGKITRLPNIKDTRQVKDDENLWGAKDNACSFLLAQFLDSAPWRLPIVTAVYSALFNKDISAEAKTKN